MFEWISIPFLLFIATALAFLLAIIMDPWEFRGFLWSALFVSIFAVSYFFIGERWETSLQRWKNEDKQKAAERAAEAAPRKLWAQDGCEGWAFKPDDRWKYYVKCDNAKVTTQQDYKVRSGKTTKIVEESITTESQK